MRHAVPPGRRLIVNNFVFQENNDPEPCSNYSQNYLKRKEVPCVSIVMNWPAQSPDLNPNFSKFSGENSRPNVKPKMAEIEGAVRC